MNNTNAYIVEYRLSTTTKTLNTTNKKVRILRQPQEMSQLADLWHREGLRIGLVPTMGALHAGHLSLFRLLDGCCDRKVASIFVNPIQFGPEEDYTRYPRDEVSDLSLLTGAGCDVVFAPERKAVFPDGFSTYIEPADLLTTLCAPFRPGHFRGVSTIVLKLFNVTRCDAAAFGLKDYQQAMVIRRMVRDLDLPVELHFGETLREPDGLAMSSRNRYLSSDERRVAATLPHALEAARRMAAGGAVKVDDIIRIVSQRVVDAGAQVQYVQVVDPDNLSLRSEIGSKALLAAAIFVGRTRLIDNVLVGPEGETKPIAGGSVE